VTDAPAALVASVEKLAGRFRVGAPVSVMVTVCVAVPVLPTASVALQVIVWTPTVKGPESFVTGTRLPSTRSVAEALPKATTVVAPLASAVISIGAVTVGAVVSTTVMVKLPEIVRLALSVAEQLTIVAPSAKVAPEAGVQLAGRLPSTISDAVAL